MGNPITLEDDEKAIYEELQTVFDSLWKEENVYNFEKLEELARKLHLKLKDRGKEPRHHSYMIKNRGCQPHEEGFYHHLHSVEDLIKFIKNEDANKDPEDLTIGETFDFSFFNRRWDRDETYKLKRTKTGWHIDHIGIGGECDKSGSPYILKNFDQDFVSYPHNIDDYFASIWERAERGDTKEEVQQHLNKVGELISLIEKNKPQDILT